MLHMNKRAIEFNRRLSFAFTPQPASRPSSAGTRLQSLRLAIIIVSPALTHTHRATQTDSV